MATQTPQSLPSFAQAFGAPSLSRISDASNALPPIHSRASPFDHHARSSPTHEELTQLSSMADPARHSSRKRARPEPSAQGDDNVSSGSDERRSPRSVRIKEEAEYDALPSPTTRAPPPMHPQREREPSQAAQTTATPAPEPAPSATRPSPSKKRRVTISGISHPINTDVRPPPTDPNKSISPVVMGLPIPRDDAAAIEQVRSMLSVKQQQKELIEQRRGSTAGLVSGGSGGGSSVSVNVVNAPPHQTSDERQHQNKSHVSARTDGRSPITAAPRRSIVALSTNAPPNRAVSPLTRQSSPPPLSHSQHVPSQPMLHPPHPIAGQEQHTGGMHQHALPAPPISFARRRATRQLGGAKGKPADIMISPRDAAADRLQPSIQSAPPIPRAGTGQGMTGRFGSMALPSLPPVLGPGQSAQRMTVSRVPPTPTRLSIARNPAGASSLLTPTVGSISGAASGRSPPAANVPIATALMPPTPAALHAPGYSGEKAAFLAPFEMFYDALADSKTLKQWLGEQLHKSQALAAQLQRQQEHLDELVGAAVERRLAPMREEMYGLHRKVEELEHALHHAVGGEASSGVARTSSGGPAQVQTYSPGTHKGKAKANGIPPPAGVPESYQFPPSEGARRPDPVRRALSPAQLEREGESRSFPGSQTGSPVPFDVGRRLSVSAIRLDPRSPAMSEPTLPTHHRARGERELGGRALPPPPSAAPGGGGGSWSRPWSPRGTRVSLPAAPGARSAMGHPSERPGIVRRASAQRVAGEGYVYPAPEGAEGRAEGVRERERAPEREKEKEREGAASSPPPPPPPPSGHPPRRDARSPEPMEE
ncbi:hypothetical protein C8Q78DRAFT_1080497 [Trametes maxima]|nr:hypothetical protein C8Q78DRAFT_1080497 [Trametes maxima]